MDYDEDEEEESDDPDDAPTSPLLQNGFRMSAGKISYKLRATSHTVFPHVVSTIE